MYALRVKLLCLVLLIVIMINAVLKSVNFLCKTKQQQNYTHECKVVQLQA